MDHVVVTVFGNVGPGEARQRAVHDLKQVRTVLHGDVDVVVRRTIYGLRGMQAATAIMPVVEQVIAAAVECKVITARRQIRSISFHRPIVDGLDRLWVDFREADGRLLLI